MATPRKPDAKRGRPSKPKALKLPSRIGRPLVPLRQHPDRYSIALYHALVVLFESERAVSKLMVAMAVRAASTVTDHAVQYSIPVSVFDKCRRAADRLRKLATRYGSSSSSADKAWLGAVAEAIVIASVFGMFSPETDSLTPESAKRAILRRAGAVGEVSMAHRVLLPMIDDKPPSSDDERDSLARIFADFLSQADRKPLKKLARIIG